VPDVPDGEEARWEVLTHFARRNTSGFTQLAQGKSDLLALGDGTRDGLFAKGVASVLDETAGVFVDNAVGHESKGVLLPKKFSGEVPRGADKPLGSPCAGEIGCAPAIGKRLAVGGDILSVVRVSGIADGCDFHAVFEDV
jgi:hypothetical protein